MSFEKYRDEQREISKLLRSEGGKRLIEKLRRAWDTGELIGDNPQHTAYRVGKRDAFRELEDMMIKE